VHDSSKASSEAINQRTDNTMTKRKYITTPYIHLAIKKDDLLQLIMGYRLLEVVGDGGRV
jgi:hypothetical protein